ncbi:VOC family protein [soil metagenome]
MTEQMTDPSTTPTAAHALTSPPPPTVWPCLNYADAHAAIRFAVDVLGFVETAAYTDDASPDVIVHAELRWPEGGGVMLGTANRADSEFSQKATGTGSVYVVTDQPREIHARATAAGATIVRELREEDYGSLGFSVRDPEGNIWSFGTYRGD